MKKFILKNKRFSAIVGFIFIFLSIFFANIYDENSKIKYIKCPTRDSNGNEILAFLDRYFMIGKNHFYFNWDKEKQMFLYDRLIVNENKYWYETDNTKHIDELKNPLIYLNFRIHKTNGFLFVNYEINGVAQPEQKLYGCYQISKKELPQS